MIAKVKGIEYISAEEASVKLESRNEKGKIVMQILLYVPKEDVNNYSLGQNFTADLEDFQNYSLGKPTFKVNLGGA